jgi:hypothetical protein
MGSGGNQSGCSDTQPIQSHDIYLPVGPSLIASILSMAFSVSVLMVQYGLTEDQCNKQISKVHIGDISRSACRKWRLIPAYLGMKDIVISDIEHEATSEEERRNNFLNLWRDEQGNGATYRVLIEALLEIKCRSDAEYICQLLQNPSSKYMEPTSQKSMVCRDLE